MFKRKFMTLTFGAVLMSAAAFAQEDYTAYKSDASVQTLGSTVTELVSDSVVSVGFTGYRTQFVDFHLAELV